MRSIRSYIAFSEVRRLTESPDDLHPVPYVAMQHALRHCKLPFFIRRDGDFIEFNVRQPPDARRAMLALEREIRWTPQVLLDGMVGQDYCYVGRLLQEGLPMAQVVASDPSRRSRAASNLVITIRAEPN